MRNVINVVMVGPSAAGKTSVLSVMLHEMENFIHMCTLTDPSFRDGHCLLSFNVEGLVRGELEDDYRQLLNLACAARKTDGPVDMCECNIFGGRGCRCTPVSFKMGMQEIIINFWEFPGGFYSSAFLKRNEEWNYRFYSKEDILKWENIVQDADVIFLTVDAAAQFGEGPLFRDNTYYSRVTELVKDSIQRSMTTLVFAPVKCEHLALEASYDDYTDEIETPFSKTGCQSLLNEVESLFSELVKYVQDPNTWNNVDAFFVPIITVGGIKFTGLFFNPCTLRPELRFSPVVPDHYEKTPFRPQNCEKVFALCLLRAYRSVVEEWKKSAPWRFFERWKRKMPFEVFFDKLSEAIHFPMMIFRYCVSNPDFLNSQGETGKEMQSACEEYVKRRENDKAPEDGCVALNPVYWPTNIR